MELKAVKKGLGPGSTATPKSAVSPGPGPLQTKTREDSLSFQCQVIEPSHGSLTSMQDAAITKHPAQNFLPAQKFQPMIPNEIGTTFFAPFPTGQAPLDQKRALFRSLAARKREPNAPLASRSVTAPA
jgi:hypothetical protein